MIILKYFNSGNNVFNVEVIILETTNEMKRLHMGINIKVKLFEFIITTTTTIIIISTNSFNQCKNVVS